MSCSQIISKVQLKRFISVRATSSAIPYRSYTIYPEHIPPAKTMGALSLQTINFHQIVPHLGCAAFPHDTTRQLSTINNNLSSYFQMKFINTRVFTPILTLNHIWYTHIWQSYLPRRSWCAPYISLSSIVAAVLHCCGWLLYGCGAPHSKVPAPLHGNGSSNNSLWKHTYIIMYETLTNSAPAFIINAFYNEIYAVSMRGIIALRMNCNDISRNGAEIDYPEKYW